MLNYNRANGYERQVCVQKSGFVTKKRIILGLVVVAIAAGVHYGPGLFGSAPEQQQGGFGVPVETYVVSARPLNVTIDSVGTLVANESVVLRPEATGRITDINFVEGRPVKKGDVLFQIDDRMARAELKQAEANLQLARLNDARFSKLATTGAATKRTRDEARANLGVSQATVDLARARLDYTRITAPFDGVVGLRSVSPGDYVNIGQELANFVSYDPMKVNFTIPEVQSTQLAVDQQIDMTVEALPGEIYHGTVFALDPQLDVNGRAVNLRATVPNTENRLKPGMFARIQLIISQKQGALVVPENAIVPQGNNKMVFVVDAENKANMVPVTLGERLAGEVEITQGLKEGDVVVTSGQIKLQPGAQVTNLSATPAPVDDAAPAAEPVAEPAPAPVAEETVEAQPEPIEPAIQVPIEGETAEPVPADEGDVTEEGAAQ